MSKTYTQEQIDHAIAMRDGVAPDRSPNCDTDADINFLIVEAWCAVFGGDAKDDALEAAARLREGKLPGTPEWAENEDEDLEE